MRSSWPTRIRKWQLVSNNNIFTIPFLNTYYHKQMNKILIAAYNETFRQSSDPVYAHTPMRYVGKLRTFNPKLKDSAGGEVNDIASSVIFLVGLSQVRPIDTAVDLGLLLRQYWCVVSVCSMGVLPALFARDIFRRLPQSYQAAPWILFYGHMYWGINTVTWPGDIYGSNWLDTVAIYISMLNNK